MGKSFKIDHPDGTFVTPSGKTVTVRGGVATVEEAPTPAAQVQMDPSPNQDSSPGWVKGINSFGNAMFAGAPVWGAAGLNTLYDKLKEKFGGTPGPGWDENLRREQEHAGASAGAHPALALAGGIASPLNELGPVGTGLGMASYTKALGGSNLESALSGLGGAGFAGAIRAAPGVAKSVSEYGPAIVKGIKEGKGHYLKDALNAIDEVKARNAQPKSLPQMPRRPPSMRTPEASPPDEFVGPPPVDPRMRARVENLPGNAVDTVVDAAPAIPPEVPVMPEAPPRMQPNPRPNIDPRVRAKGEALPRNAPKTEVTPLPSTDYAPFENPALGPLRKPPAPKTAVDAPPPEPPTPVEFQMHPEDAAKIDVPDDGLMAKLQEMVRRTSPVGTGKPSWPGAETGSMRAVAPEAPVAPVARGPVRSEFQAPKGDWLDELRTSLKSQWGEGKDVAKAMEDPAVRMRARGEKP